MARKQHGPGFSHEEIVREHAEETEVDIEQEKRTIPVEDGPGDHGRRARHVGPESGDYPRGPDSEDA